MRGMKAPFWFDPFIISGAANGSGGFGQYWLPPLGPCGFLPTVYTTRTDDAIKTPQEAN